MSALERNEDGTLGPEHVTSEGRELEPEPTCECGAERHGSTWHSPYCPVGISERREPRDVLKPGDDGSGLFDGEGRSQEEGYDLASADVVLPLATGEAMAIADALELLAGVDEGEHTDYDELVRLAAVVRSHIEKEET